MQFRIQSHRSPLFLVLLVLLGLGLMLWAGLATHPFVTLAQTPSLQELRQQRQQVEQQRTQILKQRDQLRGQENAVQKHLKGLKQQIKATSTQIQATESRLQQETRHLQTLEASLVKTEQAFYQRQFSTVARLRFLQRQQLDRGWAVLLQSENLNQFLDRRRQLRQVYKADRQMLTDLQEESKRLEKRRDQVEQSRNQTALLQQELLTQKADFESQANSQQEMITRLKSDRRALEAAESQLAKDSQSIALLIRQRSPYGGVAIQGNGQFVYPSDGPITSGFGWRLHPILGYRRFHAGIDFGADYGTVIFAADQGTVILAGWYGGYGNAVVIDHGNGLTTLYGHASELYVSEGQTVQRGQPIAAVGSTGLSTGPHLHFEVRTSGNPVDPIAFL
ncbi:MAG: murein hydrolase activator EnvC family protein [Leptolyngbyaceae cyanobacterium]